MSGIAGILLAAGSSRRFGADKRLMTLADGVPMVLASARKLANVCPNTRVILRADDAMVGKLLAKAGLETVVCEAADLGLGHSLSCGVRSMSDAAGWLIALADMPYIQTDSYRCVLQTLQRGARLARPIHAGRPGHPVGFDSTCFEELVALTGDRGGQTVLDKIPSAVEFCSVDDPGVLKDVDRPS